MKLLVHQNDTTLRKFIVENLDKILHMTCFPIAASIRLERWGLEKCLRLMTTLDTKFPLDRRWRVVGKFAVYILL